MSVDNIGGTISSESAGAAFRTGAVFTTRLGTRDFGNFATFLTPLVVVAFGILPCGGCEELDTGTGSGGTEALPPFTRGFDTVSVCGVVQLPMLTALWLLEGGEGWDGADGDGCCRASGVGRTTGNAGPTAGLVAASGDCSLPCEVRRRFFVAGERETAVAARPGIDFEAKAARLARSFDKC